MNFDYSKTSTRDFEDIPGYDIFQRAEAFQGYLDFLDHRGYLNYMLMAQSGCGSEIELAPTPHIEEGNYISFVCNDYLGFTQHPLVKETVKNAVEQYGTGAGASPLIGGYFEYHQQVEDKISRFFKRPAGSTIIYTTGYTSNSATLLSLLKKQDIAIVDMAVHASVYEGISGTTVKRFLHNDIDSLELILSRTTDNYQTKMVIIDGVYSQDGDIAKLKEILEVTHRYGALLMVDDAHGIGVVGETGRGAMEMDDVLEQVDFITGTFSKTFGNVGGYFVGDPSVVTYLRYQSRQYAFSASAPATVLGVGKAIDLIDDEPEWNTKLWQNIEYFKSGLETIGLEIGNTQSAIVPVKIGNVHTNSEAAKILLANGIYTNPIMYPAVSLKDSRIRMSVMATHTIDQLDKTLNIFEFLSKKLEIAVE
jgi:glycine C-acetyltransferase